MIMQFNRSQYKDGQLEKLFHKMPILQKFYPQRFLEKNRQEVETKRATIVEIRSKLKLLNENLKMYKQPSNLLEILDQTTQFI